MEIKVSYVQARRFIDFHTLILNSYFETVKIDMEMEVWLMNGLVLEGGTFRPIFSSGVMDALLTEDIMLPYCIGVSAGIADGVSYISKQKGRNLDIITKYRNDKRYMGPGNYRKQKSLFGLDFVFGEIPDKLVPFDKETFFSYEGTCKVGVTNAKTGEAEFLNAMDMDEVQYAAGDLRASALFPGNRCEWHEVLRWRIVKHYPG